MKEKEQEPQALELAPHNAGPMAVQKHTDSLDIGSIIQQLIKQGANAPEAVGVMKELLAMQERQEDRNAAREFNEAFKNLQAELPAIVADTPVPDKIGNTKYRFAAYEDIWAKVKPYLLKHGFSVSFDTEYDEKTAKLTKVCKLSHIGGHTRENRFTVRVGSGPYGASETQADGAAGTYAKRFALCDALNINISKDADANLEGTPIDKKKAEELRKRCENCDANVDQFLAMAGAASFEEIMSTKLPMMEDALARKERAYAAKLKGGKA